MISLAPPYRVIDGYALLPDHADPALFYVIPPAPRLARSPDGGPALSLLQYLGGGTGSAKIAGGLLTLTTELAVPDEALAALRQRLAGSPGAGADSVRLTPVLFDEGSVELVALGASSGAPAAPADGDAPPEAPAAPPAAARPAGPFAIQFLGSGRPSLGGANTATFQLVLDAAAAELLERALDAPDLPVIVIYRMAFAGLRPSFEITVDADWRRLYHSLTQKAGVNVWYVAADAERVVTTTLEESGITIDTKVFGTGPGAQAAAERARKQLVDWVLERLFTPMTDAAGATAGGIGRAIDDTVWSLMRSVVPGVGYRLRAIDDEQLRFLSAQMHEAVAERREVIPQGTLGAVLRPYRVDADGREHPGWRALRDRLVPKVNLDGFPRVEVKVAVEDRFASDGLREAQVELARSAPDGSLRDQRAFAFRAAGDRHEYVVNLLGESPEAFRTPYRYRVRAAFDPAGPFGPHEPAVSDWRSGNTTELYAEPRSAYAIRTVQVSAAPTFSFAQFPAVTVEIEYGAEGDAARQAGRVRLSQERPEGTWRFRSFASGPLPYACRITYHRAGGEPDIEGPWRQEIGDWLAVPDPLPTKRTVNLFVNLPWPEIATAYVQLRYTDDANGIHYDEQIDLAPAARYVRRDYAIARAGPRAIAYRLTMLLQAGGLLEGSWRETEDDRLVLDRRLVERRVVTVRAVGGLVENRLSDVRVSLQVRDPSTDQVRAETEVRLTPGGAPPAPWEYLLGDPPARTVRVSAVFVDTNGFVQRTPWQTTGADLVVVDLRARAIRA